MAMSKPVIVMCLVVALSMAASADQLVVTRASINPGRVLPGAPFWLAFTVKNVHDRAVQIPRSFVVEVTPESGEAFLVRHVTSFVGQLPHEYKTAGEILPGETVEVELTSGSEIGDGLLFDKRLWRAGTYRFRLILSNELQDARLERERWTTLLGSGAFSVAPLVTPAMSVEVVNPSGVDAAAWTALMEANRGLGLLTTGPNGPRIARELWEKYPSSGYAPYFAQAIARDVLRNGGETRRQSVAALHDMILKIDSVGILAEGIRLGRARTKELEIAAQPDLESAIRMTGEARADLEALAVGTIHELTRLRARAVIRQMKSTEALQETFAAHPKAQ